MVLIWALQIIGFSKFRLCHGCGLFQHQGAPKASQDIILEHISGPPTGCHNSGKKGAYVSTHILYIYTYTCLHTHTHIYIYIYACIQHIRININIIYNYIYNLYIYMQTYIYIYYTYYLFVFVFSKYHVKGVRERERE